jgi:hypothetical protein
MIFGPQPKGCRRSREIGYGNGNKLKMSFPTTASYQGCLVSPVLACVTMSSMPTLGTVRHDFAGMTLQQPTSGRIEGYSMAFGARTSGTWFSHKGCLWDVRLHFHGLTADAK